jgi:hypothetical protein
MILNKKSKVTLVVANAHKKFVCASVSRSTVADAFCMLLVLLLLCLRGSVAEKR